MKFIYLDNNASTPTDRAVVDAIVPFFTEIYSNPSSTLHMHGNMALESIREAQETIAEYLGVYGEDIIFTSGATESNNLAIKGAIYASAKPKKHIITSLIEHECVLETCRALEVQGVDITYVSVNKDGFVDVSEIEAAITEDTVLISIMTANNEIGTIQPIQKIGELAASKNIPFHTDATQYISTGMLNLRHLKADLVSFSGHKYYAPKGIGCLYVNTDSVKIEPQILGGHQQRNYRSGTMNVPGIVGISVATRLAYINAEEENRRIARQRDMLLELISKDIEVIVNGSMLDRIHSNLNISIPGVSAIALSGKVPDVMFSAGSACATSNGNFSHVLKALGLDDDLIKCSIRLSLGRFTTDDDVIIAAEKIIKGCRQVRSTGSRFIVRLGDNIVA